MITPCPTDVAPGRATRLCWGHVGKDENIIFCMFYVTLLYFGPYFVDIGHDFVELDKI